MAEAKKTKKYKCGDIKEESCYKVGKFCYLDTSIPSNYKYTGISANGKEFVFMDPEGGRHEYHRDIYSINGCAKNRGGPELDEEFYRLIDTSDILENKPKGRRIVAKVNLSSYHYGEPADLGPLPAARWNDSSAAVAAIPVPSSANLVVSDLPRSNSGVAKTEQVMEQVMAANVSKGMLSRQKSLEVLASPAAQHYVDLRVHLTQNEVRQLDSDMLAVHSGVEEILGQHLSSADEKKSLQKLFDDYDLCKYVRTANDKKLTIPKLTAILESFGE